jgi:hypothetical protein
LPFAFLTADIASATADKAKLTTGIVDGGVNANEEGVANEDEANEFNAGEAGAAAERGLKPVALRETKWWVEQNRRIQIHMGKCTKVNLGTVIATIEGTKSDWSLQIEINKKNYYNLERKKSAYND